MAESAKESDEPPPPRKNADLIGHGGAEAVLLEAWQSGRLAHAWLLCGPAGIGKATLAYRFARFVLAGGGEGGPVRRWRGGPRRGPGKSSVPTGRGRLARRHDDGRALVE